MTFLVSVTHKLLQWLHTCALERSFDFTVGIQLNSADTLVISISSETETLHPTGQLPKQGGKQGKAASGSP